MSAPGLQGGAASPLPRLRLPPRRRRGRADGRGRRRARRDVRRSPQRARPRQVYPGAVIQREGVALAALEAPPRLARAEIEQETTKAREALRARVAELAVMGAEKILRKEIDAEAHQDIVDSVAQQI